MSPRLLTVLVVLPLGCSTAVAPCSIGSETCRCTAGGSCDQGLACRADVCVKVAAADGGAFVDAGTVDGGPDDAGHTDAGALDAGANDAGVVDAGPSTPRAVTLTSGGGVTTGATYRLHAFAGGAQPAGVASGAAQKARVGPATIQPAP